MFMACWITLDTKSLGEEFLTSGGVSFWLKSIIEIKTLKVNSTNDT